MPADDAYIDTSALAKRYLNEAGSAEIDGYLASRERVFISRLTIVELHCVFARRRRNHEVTSEHEQQALSAVAEDVSLGFFQVQPLDEAAFVVAIEHIKRLRHVALRTLDALHLAIAIQARADVIVTADRGLAEAARALDFKVVTVGITPSR